MKDGGPAFPSEQGETENGIWNPTYVPANISSIKCGKTWAHVEVPS